MNAGELHRLARALREVALAATADVGDERVSPGDLAIVEDVAHHGGTSIGEVARRTGLAQSLVSKTVARMREAGVFITAADPSDGRRIQVRVSPATRNSVFESRGARPIEPALRELRPRLSADDIRRIDELLDELAAHIRLPSSPSRG